MLPRSRKNGEETFPPPSSLERVLRRQLDHARIVADRRGDSSERRRTKRQSRLGKPRLIEDIEPLKAELCSLRLCNAEDLEQRCIGRVEARANNHATRFIARLAVINLRHASRCYRR